MRGMKWNREDSERIFRMKIKVAYGTNNVDLDLAAGIVAFSSTVPSTVFQREVPPLFVNSRIESVMNSTWTTNYSESFTEVGHSLSVNQ